MFEEKIQSKSHCAVWFNVTLQAGYRHGEFGVDGVTFCFKVSQELSSADERWSKYQVMTQYIWKTFIACKQESLTSNVKMMTEERQYLLSFL